MFLLCVGGLRAMSVCVDMSVAIQPEGQEVIWLTRRVVMLEWCRLGPCWE